jgi:steroid delta-isomerase-like uncharacterized protein
MPAHVPEGKEPIMSEQNKALSRRAFEEIWNQGKLQVIDELVAPNCVLHDPMVPGGKASGTSGYKQFAETYRSAFPDLHFAINDQVAEGEKVATRYTATGTFKGELMGIAPNGKHATVSGITFDRYHDGKLIEGWLNYDGLGLFQQLGIVNMPTPAGVKA